MDIKYLYRISDAGNTKAKLDVATKMYCLDNFIKEFNCNIFVFADNCGAATLQEIKNRGIDPIEIALGNAASWRYIVQYAIDNFKKDSYVYLIEDDYLHLPGALKALEEGLQIADYVTLYDHPDKYIDHTPNPYILHGGELTRVLITKSTHWKYTSSTTMTFAASVKTLIADKEVWWYFTNSKMPDDFFAFQTLGLLKLLFSRNYYRKSLSLLPSRLKVKKKRILISSLPGLATHTELDWLAPLTIWHNNKTWNDA